MKKRIGEPWIPASAYGALLPQFTVNLIVREIDRSLGFYRDILEAQVHYSDADFAAIRLMGIELMLHADHTYEHHPWADALNEKAARGLGAELRLLGMDPDAVAERAAKAGCLVRKPEKRGHGWREAMLRDPDGYVWAVGIAEEP